MIVKIQRNPQELGRAAAAQGARAIRRCIEQRGKARLVFSTGASQFELYKALAQQSIDWAKVEAFHLDEYIGLPLSHKASFRKYLQERFVDVMHPGVMHFVSTEGNIGDEILRIGAQIMKEPIDLGFIGIGENGHLAFNDPPADFQTEQPYIIVNLNEACKAQQVGEGWFAAIGDVPSQAVSMSISGILRCRQIISCVPGAVKAQAVYNTLVSGISPLTPSTKLREHGDVTLYLDEESAGLLDSPLKKEYVR